MIIGVMADSHDNVPAIEKAVNLFNSKKVGFVIHAGDFVAPFSLAPLSKLTCPWIGVFGNNDGEQKGLTSLSKGRIQPSPFELNLDGKKVVVTHQIESYEKEELIEQGAQLVIYGHTHETEIKTIKDVLFVNPGELGGWLTGRCTLVLVDTKKMEANLEELSL